MKEMTNEQLSLVAGGAPEICTIILSDNDGKGEPQLAVFVDCNTHEILKEFPPRLLAAERLIAQAAYPWMVPAQSN